MKLLVFVLNQPEKLEEILAGFVELDITGATVLDSVGMGQFLASESALFAGFRSVIRGTNESNKTITTVIQDDAIIDQVIPLIEEVCGPLDEPGTGILFTLPIDQIFGMRSDSE
ncbi:MAG: P-II family nitrogen regulator [Candidatus Eisenbacteria bacterium]|uniref:P-II family nitrogen regulator n=1 Tax=Eiseniibacteriota bacterium TaxID=2212470 RepID=A0A7Y2EF71_UNCEI|nr:P-II family nitrogen regulator [Candidatus Eisenbacteria bacterium]